MIFIPNNGHRKHHDSESNDTFDLAHLYSGSSPLTSKFMYVGSNKYRTTSHIGTTDGGNDTSIVIITTRASDLHAVGAMSESGPKAGKM